MERDEEGECRTKCRLCTYAHNAHCLGNIPDRDAVLPKIGGNEYGDARLVLIRLTQSRNERLDWGADIMENGVALTNNALRYISVRSIR